MMYLAGAFSIRFPGSQNYLVCAEMPDRTFPVYVACDDGDAEVRITVGNKLLHTGPVGKAGNEAVVTVPADEGTIAFAFSVGGEVVTTFSQKYCVKKKQ